MDEEEVEDEEEEDKVRPSREHPQKKLLNIYIFLFRLEIKLQIPFTGSLHHSMHSSSIQSSP